MAHVVVNKISFVVLTARNYNSLHNIRLFTVKYKLLNLRCGDVKAQSVSKSIPNELEDAEGKLWLCESAIYKGQMFLHFLKHRLCEYH